MQYLFRYKLNIILGVVICFLFQGCTKFVQIGSPPNQLLSSNVFNTSASANSAITGIYGRMMSSNGFASGGTFSVTLLSGLSSDELTNFSTQDFQSEFYTNTLIPTNIAISSFLWPEPYQYIYTANSILEGFVNNSNITDSVKRQISGESLFVRAFCYFYLTNLFGDVPLNLTSNYQQNAVSLRTPSSAVMKQVIADLINADSMLASDYSVSNGEKTRPNKYTADALLARAYLYTHNWDSAAIVSTRIINSGIYNLPSDLDNVFLANSDEAIWQLAPNQPGYDTQEGYNFILTADPSSVAMSDSLRLAFEPGDLRYMHWVGVFSDGSNTWYFPYKYKVQTGSSLTEYSMVFRLAEQYLIRAEAEANGAGNGLPDAISDLNVIRNRAGLTAYSGSPSDQTAIMNAILHERQVELFTEWGHRWLDLKRLQKADQILGPIKSPSWQSTDTLYPIPYNQIQGNPAIIQNPGY